MAIVQAEIRKTVAEFVVTEVRGQPTNQDIDHLKEELIAVASSIPMMLGGGNNGHAGMLLKPIRPTNPSGRTSMLTRHAKQLQHISKTSEARKTRSQTRTHISDLDHAMCVMEQHITPETVHAIFDEASGKTLKYRQLLSHPNYKEVWSTSSANEFRQLAQGVGS